MVDLESLARQRDRAGAAPGPALMVFISFSLPDATLQRLVEQAEISGAVLLLRGLEQQSLLRTTEHARRLIGRHQVAWQIDPRAFRQYAVQQAPTFVLARSGAGSGCGALQCAAAADYLAVAGDVSLDYALEHMAGAAPEYAGLAGQYLARMRRQR
ncbi:type-F conjugative transfer system pilin assembly protein TrbC [Rugamonas aquatica]|nr:type-F conjugative transfer system pilin assembly protein TrbC [Rugamonas aquatica]